MFTGLIETTGKITAVSGSGSKKEIWIEPAGVFRIPDNGGSVAVDGVCQTVTASERGKFKIEALEQTLLKTTFSDFRIGRIVNLEKALSSSDPLGGHIVQGHVNGTGMITDIKKTDSNIYLEIKTGSEISEYCITEGSICIDGISFTIASLEGGIIIINVIPETWKRTSLPHKSRGDRINIETDIIGRYVYSFLSRAGEKGSGITMEKLKKWGYQNDKNK